MRVERNAVRQSLVKTVNSHLPTRLRGFIAVSILGFTKLLLRVGAWLSGGQESGTATPEVFKKSLYSNLVVSWLYLMPSKNLKGYNTEDRCGNNHLRGLWRMKFVDYISLVRVPDESVSVSQPWFPSLLSFFAYLWKNKKLVKIKQRIQQHFFF